jgi:DNA-binding MarR family transcriptional regulator
VTTKQWLLLVLLVKTFPGRAPGLTECARLHGSTRQNVKHMAEQLQKKGFLKITRDPRDSRVLRRQNRMMGKLFAFLDEEETAVLHGIVTKWTACRRRRADTARSWEWPGNPSTGRSGAA